MFLSVKLHQFFHLHPVLSKRLLWFVSFRQVVCSLKWNQNFNLILYPRKTAFYSNQMNSLDRKGWMCSSDICRCNKVDQEMQTRITLHSSVQDYSFQCAWNQEISNKLYIFLTSWTKTELSGFSAVLWVSLMLQHLQKGSSDVRRKRF